MRVYTEMKQKTIGKTWIYLDDVRVPTERGWVLVKNYEEFVDTVNRIGLENIELISLDHDLGETAMAEYFNNVHTNFTLDYNNITEKTGMDCAKWLVEQWMDGKPVCQVTVHSANPVGSANMMGYINNYYMNADMSQSCVRVRIPHAMPSKVDEGNRL